ncbi:MAG: hypothetical protein JXB19_06520 [Bacteroidales bacterium]|nr:hypothetical protein [Bacteroidales bacterium]
MSRLPGLYGLTVKEILHDSITPALLTSLKYLSLPEDVFEDSTYIASLRNSLSERTIVPNSGLCLGSGWLFLIFPMIFLFLLIRRKPAIYEAA